jgi:hypothetical protein
MTSIMKEQRQMAMVPVLPSPRNREAVLGRRYTVTGRKRGTRDEKKGNCIDRIERIGSSEASGSRTRVVDELPVIVKMSHQV